jgi:hypothetical protein
MNSEYKSFCIFTTEYDNDDYINGECHTLVYDDYNNRASIRSFVIPDVVNKIIFGEYFNKDISGIIWPNALHTLIFGDNFQCDISKVLWHECINLKTIEFKFGFNQTNVKWPPKLQNLFLGNDYDQDISKLDAPSLHKLHLGDTFNQDMNTLEHFPKLKLLFLGDMFNKDISAILFPQSLDIITFGSKYNFNVSHVNFQNISMIRDYSCKITHDSCQKFIGNYIIWYKFDENICIYKSIIVYKKSSGTHTKAANH